MGRDGNYHGGSKPASAHIAAGAIRRGVLSSVELLEACLARIAAREGRSARGVISPATPRSGRRVKRTSGADRASCSGRCMDSPSASRMSSTPPTCLRNMAARACAAAVPTRDADAVARLRQAGAVIIGKTVTSEFGMYAPTSCRNPHDATARPACPRPAPPRRWRISWCRSHSARSILPRHCCRRRSAARSATSRVPASPAWAARISWCRGSPMSDFWRVPSRTSRCSPRSFRRTGNAAGCI